MADSFEWSDLPSTWAMKSHGHVAKRPDGAIARCGGIGVCSTCDLERHYFMLLDCYRNATRQRQLDAKDLACGVVDAICDDHRFWAETRQRIVAKVELMLLRSRVKT